MSWVKSLSLEEQAKLVLSLTDLTTLELDDTREKVQGLCAKATGQLGHAAAVCVYPEHIKSAKEFTQGTDVTVATVVNFPHATESLESTLELTKQAITDGVDEVDLVFPFPQFLKEVAEEGFFYPEKMVHINAAQLIQYSYNYVEQVAKLCHESNVKLKVILESGVLVHPEFILLASQTSLNAGADFIKTSTGKTPINATLNAAKLMLTTIKVKDSKGGFKASGGIKTVAEAVEYLDLAEQIVGKEFLVKEKFRFGASGIYKDIESILTTGKPLTEVKSTGY